MRFIKIEIETGYHTGAEPTVIEVDDNATAEDLEEIAREEFFNQRSYSWVECDEDGYTCD